MARDYDIQTESLQYKNTSSSYSLSGGVVELVVDPTTRMPRIGYAVSPEDAVLRFSYGGAEKTLRIHESKKTVELSMQDILTAINAGLATEKVDVKVGMKDGLVCFTPGKDVKDFHYSEKSGCDAILGSCRNERETVMVALSRDLPEFWINGALTGGFVGRHVLLRLKRPGLGYFKISTLLSEVSIRPTFQQPGIQYGCIVLMQPWTLNVEARIVNV